MMRWNKTTALSAGLALIVLGNAVALTGIYFNRSGEPDAKVTMTQRELKLPYYGSFQRENSGISFDLHWRIENKKSFYETRWGNPAWLDEKKLKLLGFDTSQPKDDRRARTRYRKMLPREAYVVLEYDGPVYQASLQRARDKLAQQQKLAAEHPEDKSHQNNVKQAQAQVEREENTYSRLFAIDAGIDQKTLRQRYPDRERYIIAAAQFRITVVSRDKSSPRHLAGYIDTLSIDSITAPYAIRRQLESYLSAAAYAARQKLKYDITVAYGKRLEPWIVDLAITQAGEK